MKKQWNRRGKSVQKSFSQEKSLIKSMLRFQTLFRVLSFLRSLLRVASTFQSILETLCSNLYDSAFSIVHLLPPFSSFFFSLFEKKAILRVFSFPILSNANRLMTLVIPASLIIFREFSTTCLTRDISYFIFL